MHTPSPAPWEMTLTYALDENDFLVHQLFSASRSHRVKRVRSMVRIMLAGMMLLFASLEIVRAYGSPGYPLIGIPAPVFMRAALFLASGLLLFLLYPLWQKYYYKKHFRNFTRDTYKNRFGVQATLTFTADHIIDHDPASETKLLLTEIEAVNEIPELFLLKLRSGVSLIIPKRKLPDPGTVKEKLEAIAARLGVPYNEELTWQWR